VRLGALCGFVAYFDASHAAKIKHRVITDEKTMGMAKRNMQLTIVMAVKQMANAHAVARIILKVSAGSPPNCQARTAAKR
jgi:hypothetical protein